MGITVKDVEIEVKRLVGQKNYPCVAAIAALEQRDYQLAVFDKIADDLCTIELAAELHKFIGEYDATPKTYLSFIAAFSAPEIASEAEFEALLWRQLQLLHNHDKLTYGWDPEVNSDPQAKDFCFSFAERGFFVVGLHPRASRLSRQLPFPALVFNLSEQFERLYENGQFESLKNTIRSRDLLFQGSVNPMVLGEWEDAEAAQYSGRNVDRSWECPFKV